MGKFSTLGVAVSGMGAAQTGLYVTGHNMANIGMEGYTRQQALQNDFYSQTVGQSGRGAMQVGLGTDVSCIRQIRNTFLDISYRREAGKFDFYDIKAKVGSEIETILGELQSQYNTDTVIKDMFNSLHELSIDTESLAARSNFISTAVTFIDKAANVYNRLVEFQFNLNEQVKKVTTEINQLLTSVDKYNRLIKEAEIAGDRANDYRDARNNAVDRLSHLLDIDYKEKANGDFYIMSEGKELVSNGVVAHLGLRYTGADYSLVEPVLTGRADILAWDDTSAQPLFKMTGPVNALIGNDSGQLKSLLTAKGLYPANYATEPDRADFPAGAGGDFDYQRAIFNVEYATIPKMMKDFDKIINKVVELVNGAVVGPDQYDLEYNPGGIEIFSRKSTDGDPNVINSYYDLYTCGNLIINPELLEDGGYRLIALMKSDNPGAEAPGGVSDNRTVLEELLAQWKNPIINMGDNEDYSIDDAYRNFINTLGVETSEAYKFANEQATLLVEVDNKRQAISAVSLDEEMRNMMMYQHAYNASARMINVIDSMIDKIVNGTGRAGL